MFTMARLLFSGEVFSKDSSLAREVIRIGGVQDGVKECLQKRQAYNSQLIEMLIKDVVTYQSESLGQHLAQRLRALVTDLRK